jgi:hypothetical protein
MQERSHKYEVELSEEQRFIAPSCRPCPTGQARWTLRLLALLLSVSVPTKSFEPMDI